MPSGPTECQSVPLSLSLPHTRHTQLHPLCRTSVALQVCNQQGLETSTWILFTPVFSCKSSTLLVNKNSRRTRIRKPSVMCTSTTFRRHLQVSHNYVLFFLTTRCKRKLVSCQHLVSNIDIFIENMGTWDSALFPTSVWATINCPHFHKIL